MEIVNAMDKIIISTFTDPMMGLSYECEPIFRKLETHFTEHIEFRYVMSGLVRNVADFMTPEERSLPVKKGIEKYNLRLAGIYEREEAITGMPMDMRKFHLFDAAHRSSAPLNIAYKAAQLACPDKADLFLYNLRYATIVEGKQTTLREEILRVVRNTNINETTFLYHYDNGNAEQAFLKDKAFGRSLGIYTLPAYLLQFGDKTLLIRQLVGFETFAEVIAKLTDRRILPVAPKATTDALRQLLQKHPLISPIELREALGLKIEAELHPLLQPLLAEGTASIREVRHGHFIVYKNETKNF